MAEAEKIQQVRNFVGKKGPGYVLNSATEEEKDYFEGTLFDEGITNLSLLSYLVSPVNFY